MLLPLRSDRREEEKTRRQEEKKNRRRGEEKKRRREDEKKRRSEEEKKRIREEDKTRRREEEKTRAAGSAAAALPEPLISSSDDMTLTTAGVAATKLSNTLELRRDPFVTSSLKTQDNRGID